MKEDKIEKKITVLKIRLDLLRDIIKIQGNMIEMMADALEANGIMPNTKGQLEERETKN